MLTNTHTYKLCQQNLPKEHFTNDSLYTCKLCQRELPHDSFTNDSIKRCLYICKSCQPEAKRISHEDILNAYTSNLKYEATTTLYIYQHGNSIKHYIDQSTIQTLIIDININTIQLLDTYTNIIIEQLSNPTPIINCIKLDNKDIIHHLQSNPPYILTILHNQHNYIYQPIKTNEMLFY